LAAADVLIVLVLICQVEKQAGRQSIYLDIIVRPDLTTHLLLLTYYLLVLLLLLISITPLLACNLEK
jgi:hypothetical protein